MRRRWDRDSSPLNNPFVESNDENLRGYESAASSSSILSTPVRLPSMVDLEKKADLSSQKNHSDSLKSSNSFRKLIPLQKQFQNHHVRPECFVARKCRSNTDNVDPMSISEFSKHSKKPIFGQIV